ncbi:MAG: hypothetical protein EB059_07220 [Alphaproteobacteria bacterium]|nr:hypothetical protein [Alphaproteobacteria bacterium]
MTEEVQNQTLALLREMRSENQKSFAELNAKVNTLAEGSLRLNNRVDRVEKQLEDIGLDLRELKNHMAVVSIVVDEHAKRFDALDGGKPPI